jgi:hypothetical protein
MFLRISIPLIAAAFAAPAFVLEHIRASKERFTAEIEGAGFTFTDDVTASGMQPTFVPRCVRS